MEVRAGYQQTEVGVIPEDWKVTTLFELAEKKKELFDDGDWIESEHITNQGVRLIQTGNIGVGHYIEKDAKKYIFESSFVSLRCKELKIGDLLICRLADPAGRACVLGQIGDEKIVTSVDVTICRPPADKADRVFLANLFSTPKWFRLVSDRSGGTTHKRISRGALGGIPIELPPLPEQRAIATALSDADALLAAQDKLIAKKRDIKQAAMQQLLTGKQRLPGFSGKWEVVKAGDIGRFRGGNGFPTKSQGAGTGEYPFFKVSDMNNVGNEIFMETANNYVSEELRKQLGATAFPAGSIVIAKVGAAVFLERKKILRKVSCLDNNMAAFVLDSSRANFSFIHYVLLNIKLGSLVSTTALPSLSGSVISEIELPLPSLSEQSAISNVLSDMDAELTSLEQQRDKTRALKQGMMQELLTGRIRLV